MAERPPHIELRERGLTAATVIDAPFLKLAVLGDGRRGLVLDDAQLRWLIEDAGPRLLERLNLRG